MKISNFSTANEMLYVPNIVPSNKGKIKYIFVFESPHTTEVNKKIPLSGKTGMYVMNKLCICDKDNTSFGEYVYSKKDTIGDIAIVNVCNIPLQSSRSFNYSKKFSDALTFVRNNHRSLRNHRLSNSNIRKIKEIEEQICNSFKANESIFKNADNIVVCGKFAKSYFNKLFSDLKYKYLSHPSRNHWDNQNDTIREISSNLNGSLNKD